MTYLVNGKEYVAISTGTSLATNGLNLLTPESHPTNTNAVYAFTGRMRVVPLSGDWLSRRKINYVDR